VAVRIAGQEEAGLWRARTKKAFEEMGEEEMKEMICEMEGSRLPRSRPEEVDLSADNPTVRLYRALRETVLGECQHFASRDLPQEDEEQEEMEWKTLAPPSSKGEVTDVRQGGDEGIFGETGGG
jgi:hypothetical protein